MMHTWRRRLTLTTFIVAWAVAAGLFTQLGSWTPPQASLEARTVDHLTIGLMVLACVIFGIVAGTVTYVIVMQRHTPGDNPKLAPAPRRWGRYMEISWIVLPLAAMSVLAAVSTIILAHRESTHDAQGPIDLTVDVRAQRFGWQFDYPTEHISSQPTLIVPVGERVRFSVSSRDVIHSFWVPAARIKQDAVPGVAAHTDWTPTRIGRYPIVCAELCGEGHAYMRAWLRIVSADDYETFIKGARS